MTSFCDVTIICFDLLVGKPLCMHTGNAIVSSAHLLASTPESPVTIDASEPLHLFHNPNFVPLTYRASGGIGEGRDCRYSGARRGTGALGAPRGVGGCYGGTGGRRAVLGLQVDWEPNHIGPQSRIPALPLVPLGEWPTWPRPSK